jgi:hypothetical protein
MMDKEKVLLFKRRYEVIEEIEIKELQNSSFSDKFLQLKEIMRLAKNLNVSLPIEDKREEEARKRWLKLKKKLDI